MEGPVRRENDEARVDVRAWSDFARRLRVRAPGRARGVHSDQMTFTLVSFHAHPDDEALLTGGTLARTAAEGHRVVLVTATDGGAAATCAAMARDLGLRRRAELEDAAAALGVARVVHLGLADSGCAATRTGDPRAFGALPAEEAAAGLTDVLRAERADVLTVYDKAGGYGHPDHRQVHAAGWSAARAAGTPSVLEATVDRALLVRVARLAGALRLLDPSTSRRLAGAFSARDDITHRVDVAAFTAAKRAALRAHASQATGVGGTEALRLLLRLPGPLFDLVARWEWFAERGRSPGRCDDVFAAVRRPCGQTAGTSSRPDPAAAVTSSSMWTTSRPAAASREAAIEAR